MQKHALLLTLITLLTLSSTFLFNKKEDEKLSLSRVETVEQACQEAYSSLQVPLFCSNKFYSFESVSRNEGTVMKYNEDPQIFAFTGNNPQSRLNGVSADMLLFKPIDNCVDSYGKGFFECFHKEVEAVCQEKGYEGQYFLFQSNMNSQNIFRDLGFDENKNWQFSYRGTYAGTVGIALF